MEQELGSARPLRILVVDDYPVAADTLRILFELWGHEVAVAHSAQQALEAAASFGPDAVLLDIEMPRTHGGELVKRLRRLPGLERTLMIATSWTDSCDPHLASHKQAFDDYLTKPFNLERLERLLASRIQAPP
jgi:CheY-like chemotaxis protein